MDREFQGDSRLLVPVRQRGSRSDLISRHTVYMIARVCSYDCRQISLIIWEAMTRKSGTGDRWPWDRRQLPMTDAYGSGRRKLARNSFGGCIIISFLVTWTLRRHPLEAAIDRGDAKSGRLD